MRGRPGPVRRRTPVPPPQPAPRPRCRRAPGARPVGQPETVLPGAGHASSRARLPPRHRRRPRGADRRPRSTSRDRQVDRRPRGHRQHPAARRHRRRRADAARGQPPGRRARSRAAAASPTSRVARARAARRSRSSSPARSSGPAPCSAPATQRLHERHPRAPAASRRAGSARHVQVTRERREPRGRPAPLRAARRPRRRTRYVEEGMRIHVPPRGGAVTLSGAVRRPGRVRAGAGRLAARAARADRRAGARRRPLARRGSRASAPTAASETLTVDLRTALARARRRAAAGRRRAVRAAAVRRCRTSSRCAAPSSAPPRASKTTTAGKPTIVQRFELAQGERVRDVVVKAGGARRLRRSAPGLRRPRGVGRARGSASRSTCTGCWSRRTRPRTSCSQNGDVLTLPVVEDKVYVVGEVKTPGAAGLPARPRRRASTWRCAGGPGNRAKLEDDDRDLPQRAHLRDGRGAAARARRGGRRCPRSP